jgi:hypothetical protein
MPAKDRHTEGISPCDLCLPESYGLRESGSVIFQAHGLLGHETDVRHSRRGLEGAVVAVSRPGTQSEDVSQGASHPSDCGSMFTPKVAILCTVDVGDRYVCGLAYGKSDF